MTVSRKNGVTLEQALKVRSGSKDSACGQADARNGQINGDRCILHGHDGPQAGTQGLSDSLPAGVVADQTMALLRRADVSHGSCAHVAMQIADAIGAGHHATVDAPAQHAVALEVTRHGAKQRDGGKRSGKDKEIRAGIARAIDASPSLRSKKDLIERFIDSLTVSSQVDEEWRAFITARRTEELERIIAEEALKPEETRTFIENAFRDGAIPTTGTAITKILPPASRFAANNHHAAKKLVVLEKLAAFFERYFSLT